MRFFRISRGRWIAAVMACTGAGALAQDPASTQPTVANQPGTQPATRPATVSEAQVGRALAQLNSVDAAQQSDARVWLMGLSRAQLTLLRQCVAHAGPVSPSVAASLHDVVIQDYLAEEPYPIDATLPSAGFLGLRWGEGMGLETPSRLGVPVGIRLPGFPSYRLLQTGDLILGVLAQPDLPLEQPPNCPTPDLDRLQHAIQSAGAAHEVVLQILRQGERVQIRVKLYPALGLPREEVEAFTDQRMAKGEAYWRETFLPLIRAGVS